VSSRWEEQALPLLVALRQATDRHVREGILMLGYRDAASLGLDLPVSVILATLFQLGDLGYVEYDNIQLAGGGGAIVTGLRVTGRGLQVLGQWPRFEAIVSPATLATLIEQLADYASPEESPPMRRAAAAVRRMGTAGLKSAAIGIGGQLLRGALGLP
jgi:hypothetical protein